MPDHDAFAYGVLVEQAAEAFGGWRGVHPHTGAMVRKLTMPLT